MDGQTEGIKKFQLKPLSKEALSSGKIVKQTEGWTDEKYWMNGETNRQTDG